MTFIALAIYSKKNPFVCFCLIFHTCPLFYVVGFNCCYPSITMYTVRLWFYFLTIKSLGHDAINFYKFIYRKIGDEIAASDSFEVNQHLSKIWCNHIILMVCVPRCIATWKITSQHFFLFIRNATSIFDRIIDYFPVNFVVCDVAFFFSSSSLHCIRTWCLKLTIASVILIVENQQDTMMMIVTAHTHTRTYVHIQDMHNIHNRFECLNHLRMVVGKYRDNENVFETI